MIQPKFIITMDGYFRLGMVHMHSDLLEPGDQCIGGGYYRFDYVSNTIWLDKSSYDFGKPLWHLIETIKVPATYRGMKLIYRYDDNFHEDFNVSDELNVEYYYRMTTKQITPSNADKQIKHLYQSAFPVTEQIPWDDLMRLVEQMHLDFTAYYEEENLIGFTIVYPRPSYNWYWYFAVSEELRGKGYGQQIMPLLIEKYKGQSFVLDMESPYQDPCPNPEQRKRRHAFYLRNGFRDTDVYRSYGDVTMTVMMMGPGSFTLQDWDDITNELKQFWWPKT